MSPASPQILPELAERYWRVRRQESPLFAVNTVTLPILDVLMLDWIEKQYAAEPAHA